MIEVYADVVCPWCFIGTERLARALTALGKSDAEVVHRPFQLSPDEPEEGSDIQAMLRKKHGVEPQKLFALAENAARETDIKLDLMKQPRSYPTLRAHTLLRHAAEKKTQRKLARALYRAYFLDARNINDVDELAAIALQHGFADDETHRLLSDDAELEATRAAVAEARKLGIRGVPLIIFDGKIQLSGAQPESVYRDVLSR